MVFIMSEPLFPQKLMSFVRKNFDKEIWRLCDEIYATEHKADDCFFVDMNTMLNRFLASRSIAWDCNSRGDFLRIGALFHALASWRPTQDVVQFDKSVYDSLLESGFDGKLPGKALTMLPAWSVYIDTPYGLTYKNTNFDGFFAALSSNKTISITFVAEKDDLTIMAYHVQIDSDLSEEYYLLNEEINDIETRSWNNDDKNREIKQLIGRALSLTLYLCAYGFGEDMEKSENHFNPPEPKRHKATRLLRVFPASGPTIRTPGTKLGEKIRQATEREYARHEGERAPMRPHIRRGHWHGFWHGKKGEQELAVKWLLPMLVASANAENEPEQTPLFPTP